MHVHPLQGHVLTMSNHFQLVEVLVTDRTWLCQDAGNNLVVLKKLDSDCLHQDQLHPSIRDRLAAIRELAHPHTAFLKSVERWNGHVCVVWAYIPGHNLPTPTEMRGKEDLAEALSHAVDQLHGLGIVHGNLHAGNIIVQADATVWLTDFSPYLYVDPQVDRDAVAHLTAGVNLKADKTASCEYASSSKWHFTPILGAMICMVFAVIFFILVRSILGTSAVMTPNSFPPLRH